MKRFIVYLTVYNLIFTLSRLSLAIIDPAHYFIRSMQFHDYAIYVLIPVFIFWSLLYLTIPAALYCTVDNVIKRVNSFNVSALTVNSITGLTFILIVFMFGINY
jgi:hypothetical protein